MAEKLTRDLNIIQNSGIEITVDPMTSDLNIIQKLDDEPNDVGGLSAQELKAKFDEAGNTIKTYINDSLIPQVLSEGITEAQREQNEAERERNEEERQSAEDIRSMNELQRNRNDDAREDAETARQTAETARQTAESARVRAEDGRVRTEDGRVFGESERETAERARETAETARETAETAREAAQAAFFQGVSAEAVTLEPGAEATASAAPVGDSFRVTIGVPRGERGPQGDVTMDQVNAAIDDAITGAMEESY